MRRRLFTFFSAISLLGCILVCATWARSHWAQDEIKWGWTGGMVWAWTPRGDLECGLYWGNCASEPPGFYGLKHGRSPINQPVDTFAFLALDKRDKVLTWARGGFS